MSDRPAELSTPEFEDDAETIALANNPKFLEILERSRQQYQAKGGILLEEMYRQLDLDQPQKLRSRLQYECNILQSFTIATHIECRASH
jgi:hypothetical protein